jgi:hypothetical protein
MFSQNSDKSVSENKRNKKYKIWRIFYLKISVYLFEIWRNKNILFEEHFTMNTWQIL